MPKAHDATGCFIEWLMHGSVPSNTTQLRRKIEGGKPVAYQVHVVNLLLALLCSNEHASVLDEIDLLRGKLSQLEHTVLHATADGEGESGGDEPGTPLIKRGTQGPCGPMYCYTQELLWTRLPWVIKGCHESI